MSRIFRTAIVGAGIGAEHAQGFAAHPELYAVAAVCDLDAARAQRLVTSISGARATATLDEVLADPTVDVVCICTPPFTHRELTLRALAAGKHVVCEKPLVGSLAELDKLERAAATARRLVLPVYQYRYGCGLGQLRRLIETGLTGPALVATIETHWNRGAVYYDVPWRGKRRTELGGAVVSHAIHAHDMLTQALGPVAAVSASIATRVNPIETEDCAAILLEMACGALVTSSVTLGSACDTSRFRFCFQHLTAESGLSPYAPGDEPWTFTAREQDRQPAIETVLADYPAHEHGFARLFALLHPALEGQAGPPVTLDDARASLGLASAIYYAAARGERVALPLSQEHPTYHGLSG
jgi:predicted dehydrogenase